MEDFTVQKHLELSAGEGKSRLIGYNTRHLKRLFSDFPKGTRELNLAGSSGRAVSDFFITL